MVAVSKKIETKKYVRILKSISPNFWYVDKIGDVYGVSEEFSLGYYIDQIGCVDKKDVELIITEKRTAKVGERVLITDKYGTSGEYKDGDILTADLCIGHAITAKEVDLTIIFHSEYEVIVNNEVKIEEVGKMDKLSKELNKRLDGGVPAPVTFNGSGGTPTYNSNSKLASIEYGALVEHAYGVLVEIERRAFEQGLEKGKLIGNAHEELPQEKTAQERRDEIVEQAKADVEKLSNRHQRRQYCGYSVEFRVNNEKRTIVVLLKGVNTGIVYTRGIAKAAPDDCFNVHIGKAIALHRALGLEVPDEYLNVPQPTEVREGDVVQAFADGDLVFEHMVKGCEVDYIQKDVNTRGTSWYAKIIDDSRTGSIES